MALFRKYGWIALIWLVAEGLFLYLTDSRWLLTFLFISPVEVFEKNYPRFWWLVYGVVKGHVWVVRFMFVWYIITNLRAAFIKKDYTSAGAVLMQFRSKEWLAKFLDRVATVIVSVGITLVLCEVVLRVFVGIIPGTLVQTRNFKSVDQLVNYKLFSADSDGITSIDAVTATKVNELVKQGLSENKWETLYSDFVCDPCRVIENVRDFKKQNFACALKNYVEQHTPPSSEIDSAIFHYLHHPINSQGFRSIDFKALKTSKKKILLLGDSFTWGHSAQNFFSSFADNLLAMGYVVYNTGITCTDPVQYEQIARKYIPLLRPDVVIMNVYLGNDVQYYIRKPMPNMPQLYVTNAGLLQNDFNGVMLSTPDSVYNNIEPRIYFTKRGSLTAKLCACTSLGTLIYRIFFAMHDIPPPPPGVPHFIQYPKVNDHARIVMGVCKDQNAQFILSVIPSLDNNRNLTTVADFPRLFDGINYSLSPVKKEGYVMEEDGHFNDRGHKEYADFLQKLIENKN